MIKLDSVKYGLPAIGERVIVRYLYSLDYNNPITPWVSFGSIEYYSNQWIVDSQLPLSSFEVTHWARIEIEGGL